MSSSLWDAAALAEGCTVHGAGFICRHEWEDVAGTGEVDREGLEGARERLAAALTQTLAELKEVRASIPWTGM